MVELNQLGQQLKPFLSVTNKSSRHWFITEMGNITWTNKESEHGLPVGEWQVRWGAIAKLVHSVSEDLLLFF